MDSFILIDGAVFWIAFILIIFSLIAMLWKSIFKIKADKKLVKENKELKAEIKLLRFRLLNSETKGTK